MSIQSILCVTMARTNRLYLEKQLLAVPRLDDHYDAIIEMCGYAEIDVDLEDFPASYLRRKFAAVD